MQRGTKLPTYGCNHIHPAAQNLAGLCLATPFSLTLCLDAAVSGKPFCKRLVGRHMAHEGEPSPASEVALLPLQDAKLACYNQPTETSKVHNNQCMACALSNSKWNGPATPSPLKCRAALLLKCCMRSAVLEAFQPC